MPNQWTNISFSPPAIPEPLSRTPQEPNDKSPSKLRTTLITILAILFVPILFISIILIMY